MRKTKKVYTVCPRSSDPFYVIYKMGHYFLDIQCMSWRERGTNKNSKMDERKIGRKYQETKTKRDKEIKHK